MLLQLRVILWKNLKLRKRHFFLLICEALVPVSLFLLVAYGRSKISGLKKQHVTSATYSENYEINPHYYSVDPLTQIYYFPKNSFFEDIIHKTQEKLQLVNNNIQGFNSLDNLERAYSKNTNASVIALIFNDKVPRNNFDYTIRYYEQYFQWQTDRLFSNPYLHQPGSGSSYFNKGLLTFQMALDFSFIEKSNASKFDVTLHSQEFPYPPYLLDTGLSALFMELLPLITLCSFIFVCPALLKRVVEEKYSGIKELMKMVGMKSWMLWLGWFIYSIIPMVCSVLLIIICMKVKLFGSEYPVIEFSDGSILFVFLILYCIAVILFYFFISTFFSKPTLATLVGLLIWILSYFVPKYLIETHNYAPFLMKSMLLLFPNMALYYGYAAVSVYEVREIGMQWNNFNKPATDSTNDLSMLNVYAMLVVDIILYSILTLYMDCVNPGKYGVGRSYIFPIMAPIKYLKRLLSHNEPKVDPASMHLEYVESGQGLQKGIELKNVKKTFGEKVAVHDLNMEIYQDQITVLLGHNGAGKSTTMGMITGMIRKTSGEILINEQSVSSHSKVMEQIGLCPQHNLLFPDLTVSEHLKFFAMLKGVSLSDSEKEIKYLLETLNLKDKANNMAHTLSGGMKRKLCLGMAVVGGSKILILDEPSSGMDPESRRHLWDLLLKWRNQKTILITTHFMEEADALGDWIAIMTDGQLRCFGTPMALKKQYDTGYHLSLILQDTKNEAALMSNLNRIHSKILKYIEGAKCKGVNGNEALFVLPFGNYYSDLFEYLETHKEDLNIEKISVTTTTLEDVFLNTNKDHKEDNIDIDGSSISEENDGGSYIGLTLRALIEKRIWFIRKKYPTYLMSFGLSLMFLFLCMYLGQGISFSANAEPSLEMKLSTYGDTTVFFSGKGSPTIDTFKDFYKRYVIREKSKFSEVDDIYEAIIQEGTDNIVYYREHMVAGVQINQTSKGLDIIALYNNVGLHSSPISLNLITNSLAKTLLGDSYSISMTFWPLEDVTSSTSPSKISDVQIGLLWLIILPIGVLFVLGTFIFFPHIELSTNFTQLQFMCGVQPYVYWFVNFVFDFIVYMVFALTMAIFNLLWTPFYGIQELFAFVYILMLYGISGIPFAYLFSRKKSASSAFALFIILGIFAGVVCSVIVMVLTESNEEYYIKKGNDFRVVFSIFCPQFVVTYMGVQFSRQAVVNYNLEHNPRLPVFSGHKYNHSSERKSYFDLPLMKEPYLIMLGGLFYFFINVLLHSYLLKYACNKLQHEYNRLKGCKGAKNEEANETLREIDCVDSPVDEYGTLKVKKLRKSYSGREVVKEVDFSVKKGDCLGLLGVNGAGKTTTFRMITREEIKDGGSVVADGNIEINENKYLKKLGYCPQNDALNYALTGREILKVMAMLRGIDETNAPKLVEKYLDLFELTKIANDPCGYYSGGNKRKLSFAVALIGIPDFILLDEPTNGVDPTTRRKFWTLINSFKRMKRTSFVLSSHSMNECEALCNDLKIMKAGTIEKQGSIAKLKEEIGGFSIKFKLKHQDKSQKVQKDGQVISLNSCKVANVEDLKSLLDRKYSGEVKDQHSGLLQYYITDKSKKWSSLFKEMEALKMENPHLIEEYSISEASLEDVFLSVARSSV